MSRQAEANRQRRWETKMRRDHQERTRMDREMGRMMDWSRSAVVATLGSAIFYVPNEGGCRARKRV